jgi:hypothetical protein
LFGGSKRGNIMSATRRAAIYKLAAAAQEANLDVMSGILDGKSAFKIYRPGLPPTMAKNWYLFSALWTMNAPWKCAHAAPVGETIAI